MINASVGILTYNSEKYLNNCLNSVIDFKEVLIFDGGSTDNTLKIAKKYNCIIKKQPRKHKFKNNKIKDFSKLRELILKSAKYELVLFLDSDEFLNKSILKKINFYSKSKELKNNYYAFLLGRFPIHKNKIITQKTIFYPNFQPRLFYKSNVKKFLKQVHEKAIPKNKNLLTMKIPHISIKFPLDSSYQNIFNKCEYYFEIEKIMLSKSKNFFRKLYFVAYRLLVLLKFITKNIFFNPKMKDYVFKNYEKNLLKLNIIFSIKLLISIFK